MPDERGELGGELDEFGQRSALAFFLVGQVLLDQVVDRAHSLSGEIVRQALHGMHAGVFHGALSDLAHGAERHAAFARNLALWDGLGTQTRHHEIVNWERSVHAC